MLGAIIGDIVGSPYEFDQGDKTTVFPFFHADGDFTDDTVMTIAVARALMDAAGDEAAAPALLVARMQEFYRAYPHPKGSYGGRFLQWLTSPKPEPYNSWGNGSAMRVSSVGWLFTTPEDVLRWAAISAEVTHNHPEGIKGAQAVALAIYRARHWQRTPEGIAAGKDALYDEITTRFGYNLSRSVDEIRPHYRHVESCQETVPEALTCFIESQDFESALRLGVSIGGDTDTVGAIIGGIAEAAYGIPAEIRAGGLAYLPPDFLAVLKDFWAHGD